MIEYVTANKREALVTELQSCRITNKGGDVMPDFKCLKHDVTAKPSRRAEDDDVH